MQKILRLILILILMAWVQPLFAQPVTGVWRGKMQRGKGLGASTIKLELKLIKQGDSLVGTVYYFMNTKNFFRYSVRGYFDNQYNAVHWWDVRMIESLPVRNEKNTEVYKMPMMSRADFNCPSSQEMRLDGESGIGGEMNLQTHLEKVVQPLFKDEWDDVIVGYFSGMARREIIDSVWAIQGSPPPLETIAKNDPTPIETNTDGPTAGAVAKIDPPTAIKAQPPPDPAKTVAAVAVPKTNEVAKNEKPAEKDSQAIANVTVPEKVETPAGKAIMPPKPDADVAKVETPKINTTPPNDKAVAKTNVPPTAVKPPVANQPTTVKTDKPASPPEIAKVVPKTSGTTTQPTTNSTSPAKKPVTEPKPAPTTVASSTKPTNTKPLPPVVVNKPVEKPATMAPKPATQTPEPVIAKAEPKKNPLPEVVKPVQPTLPVAKPVMQEEFTARQKIVQTEIPAVGDSIELQFYDNAEVDGDSISLFLNGKMLFQHVRLSVQAYSFKIAVADLQAVNELTMVAENLGAIPPNTAFMVARSEGRQYTARIESTEKTSGVIKLVRR